MKCDYAYDEPDPVFIYFIYTVLPSMVFKLRIISVVFFGKSYLSYFDYTHFGH